MNNNYFIYIIERGSIYVYREMLGAVNIITQAARRADSCTLWPIHKKWDLHRSRPRILCWCAYMYTAFIYTQLKQDMMMCQPAFRLVCKVRRKGKHQLPRDSQLAVHHRFGRSEARERVCVCVCHLFIRTFIALEYGIRLDIVYVNSQTAWTFITPDINFPRLAGFSTCGKHWNNASTVCSPFIYC